MTDRPILFSAPMVRALLGGRKTQTRRALSSAAHLQIASAPDLPVSCLHVEGEKVPRLTLGRVITIHNLKAAVGDRLYVREHWRTTQAFEDLAPSQMTAANTRIRYEADGFVDNKLKSFDHFHEGRFRQGVHMPRWASRLTLVVTDVRVERLQNISEADASAEGVWHGKTFNRFADDLAASCQDGRWFPGATDWYRDLWDRINGPGAWAANPWVAAYTFTVIPKNIDEA